MKTHPAQFTRAKLAEKLIDAEKATRGIQGLIESMELLNIDEITVKLSTSIDEGLDRVERFVTSGQRGIREQRKKAGTAGPESKKEAPKRRKKSA